MMGPTHVKIVLADVSPAVIKMQFAHSATLARPIIQAQIRALALLANMVPLLHNHAILVLQTAKSALKTRGYA
jgi:hypothetical protein